MRFACEVHPGQIAFDLYSAELVLDALDGREEFGFTFDPSHLHWQGVDPVEFLRRFPDRIYHVHVKDAQLTLNGRAGVLAGYWPSGDPRAGWQFRSPGHGGIDWAAIIRGLNEIGYDGPLAVDWHDPGMDREYGAADACRFVKSARLRPADARPEGVPRMTILRERNAMVRFVVALLATPFLVPAAQPTKPFSIDFEDQKIGEVPKGWSVAKTGTGKGSAWKIVEDTTAPKGPKVLAQTSESPLNLFNLCVVDSGSFKDVQISVAFKAVEGEDDRGGGVLWRYKDADNYYTARYNPIEKNYRLYKVLLGKRTSSRVPMSMPRRESGIRSGSP